MRILACIRPLGISCPSGRFGRSFPFQDNALRGRRQIGMKSAAKNATAVVPKEPRADQCFCRA